MGKPTTSKSSRAESGGEAGWLKRRFCMYQLQGICRKSTQECPWAHSIEEMEQSRSRGKKKASPAREESGYSSSEWTSSHGAGRSSESSSSPTPLREVVQDGFRNSHDINKPKVMPYQASSCPREPPLSTVGAGLAGVPGVGWPGPPPGLEDADVDSVCASPGWQPMPMPLPAIMQVPAMVPTSHSVLQYTQQDLTSVWAKHKEQPP